MCTWLFRGPEPRRHEQNLRYFLRGTVGPDGDLDAAVRRLSAIFELPADPHLASVVERVIFFVCTHLGAEVSGRSPGNRASAEHYLNHHDCESLLFTIAEAETYDLIPLVFEAFVDGVHEVHGFDLHDKQYFTDVVDGRTLDAWDGFPRLLQHLMVEVAMLIIRGESLAEGPYLEGRPAGGLEVSDRSTAVES